jgi:hypothetical protein
VSNLEIFGDVYFMDQTTKFGERNMIQDVIVGIDPASGDPIFEQQVVSQPAIHPVQPESTVVRFGFTYLGTIW